MKLIFFLLVGLFLCLIPYPVPGCTCPAPADVKLKILVLEALNESDAVFSGEVVELIPHFDTAVSEVKFAVQEAWKGVGTTEVTVETPIGGTIGQEGRDCGFPFAIGKTYLVYASATQGTLQTSICVRTRRLKNAGLELKILRRITRS